MKLFSDTFRLYAYKSSDRCDISIRSSDTMVYTFRLTHSEIQKIFAEYNRKIINENVYGVHIDSRSGPHWFVMNKEHFGAVRITVSVQGFDLNFRVDPMDWQNLITEYHRQMSTIQPWDNK